MSQLVIVDYGMGNIGSVVNAFSRLGVDCVVSDQPQSLKQAKGIILPGVGAFPAAMQNLAERGLDDALHEHVLQKKKPFLGICLGMQLIAEDSVESHYAKGLGWIKGHVVKMDADDSHPVPHVGWNNVQAISGSSLFKRIEAGSHFYFDHSYHLQCDEDVVLATCDYAGKKVAAVQKDNIFAFQFHPEKSQRNGLKLLRNFLNVMGN